MSNVYGQCKKCGAALTNGHNCEDKPMSALPRKAVVRALKQFNTPDMKVSQELQRIFRQLEEDIKKVGGEKMGISLCVFEDRPGSRISYISNCDRKAVAAAWASMMKGWKEGMPDIPAHEFDA